jgi:type IV pilus assembly protein PilO
MTLSDDFNFGEQGGDYQPAPRYPNAFGITFTPKVSGILIGVAGILGGAFILLNLVMPAWDTFQAQEAKKADLQGQIEQKKASISQIDKVKQELADTKKQQIQVLSLFANEKSLDSLLLDLNRLVEAGNAQTPVNGVRAKMRKYTPAAQQSEIITDSSYGPLVNGKLKRSAVTIEINGTFEQTQSIFRNIERLQPLLIVKDYDSKLAPDAPTAPNAPRRIGPAGITTTFQIQALMPLSPPAEPAVLNAQPIAPATASPTASPPASSGTSPTAQPGASPVGSPAAKPAVSPSAQPVGSPKVQSGASPGAKSEAKPGAKPEAKPEAKPQQ